MNQHQDQRNDYTGSCDKKQEVFEDHTNDAPALRQED